MEIKKKIEKILHWSEKYTKTDMIYLAKGSFWLTFRQTVSSTMAFLIAIACGYFLPKEIYGQYKYILSIISLLAITSLRKMDTALILAVAKKIEGLTKKALKTKISWSLLGSLGALLLAGYYWHQDNTTYSIIYLLAAFFLPLMESSQIYLAYLSGKKRFDLHAKYNAIIRIIATLGLILVISLTQNLILIILAYLALYTLGRIAFLWLTLKKLPPNEKSDDKYISYGKQLSFLTLINDLANQLDKIILFKFIGPIQLAIYSFATIPVQQINTILQSIRLIAAPKFSAQDQAKIKKDLPSKIFRAIAITTGLVLIYILLAPYLFKIFFPRYLDSVNPSQLFALSLILFPLTLIPSYFEAKLKKKQVYLFSILPPLLRIIFLFSLIPFYGITGAVAAIVFTTLINSLISLIVFRVS